MQEVTTIQKCEEPFVKEVIPQIANGSVATERIAFAVTKLAREQFLSHLDLKDLPEADYHLIETSSGGSFDFGAVLKELQPTVLVTGWGTPPIPEDYVSSEDLALKYVCHLSGTVKSIVPRKLIERGVIVSNWGSAISYTIAEHAMLLTLAALRKLPEWAELMDWNHEKEKARRRNFPTHSLRGRRVGIHGFGAIARELVQMLRPFRVEISSYSHNVPSSLFQHYGVHQCVTLAELFASSDVLIECEALNHSNRGSVTEEMLRLLPREAVFVNVGRGAIVDEDALIRVAKERQLRLGLDVYRKEPLPSDSPLRILPDTVLSPHIGGPTMDARLICGQFALDNLRRFLSGQNVEAQVTLDVYDRIT